MKATRLYTGTDGRSHFQDIDIPLKTTAISEMQSEIVEATGIIFRETTSLFDQDFHNAPRRQYVITLAGRAEIETGDGTKRRFGPGDIMLAEDTSGQGHITRGVGDQTRISIFVTLD